MQPCRRSLAIVLTTIAVLLAPLVARAGDREEAADPAPTVVAIEIHGNRKTTDGTVRLIGGITIGEKLGPGRLEKIRANLVSSELFEEVAIVTAPVAGGVILAITVEEKWSWIVAPTFYIQPTNIAGGVGFLESNLFGLDKKLLVYGELGKIDKFLLGIYLDPSIHGSHYYFRLDTYLRTVRVTEYVGKAGYLDDPQPTRITTEEYLNAGVMFGRNLRRGLGVDLRIRGARVRFSDAQTFDPGHPATQAPEDDGWDLSAELRLIRDHRANWYGTTNGSMVSVIIAHSLPGATYAYSDNVVKVMNGVRLPFNHNLVTRGFVGVGYHLPFQQEYPTGGENDLRGYRSSEFRGDLDFELENDYSVPLFRLGSLSFRGLGFWDTTYDTLTHAQTDGNTERHYLPGQVASKLSQWRNGVGLGFRVYFRSVVAPLLGVDVGYGIEGDELHVYFAIGLTDL